MEEKDNQKRYRRSSMSMNQLVEGSQSWDLMSIDYFDHRWWLKGSNPMQNPLNKFEGCGHVILSCLEIANQHPPKQKTFKRVSTILFHAMPVLMASIFSRIVTSRFSTSCRVASTPPFRSDRGPFRSEWRRKKWWKSAKDEQKRWTNQQIPRYKMM